MRTKATLILGVTAIVVAIGSAFYISQKQVCKDFTESTVAVDGTTFSVALADTPQEQQLGLSGCATLPEQSGMYFVYDPPRRPTFWMSGMLIPIDIIWIVDNQVVGIEENVAPPENLKTDLLPTYQPEGEVTGVLELAAGSAATYGIAQGSIVSF